MNWGSIVDAVVVAVHAVEKATRVVVRLVRRTKKPTAPPDSAPLTWRDVAHQQDQIRRAARPMPPPRKRP